jgi:hypothetical protein
MAHYAFLNNDATTETLREELSVLWSEMSTFTSIEEPTEEDTAAIEAKQAEIDAKYQEINNQLCIVTNVITGVLETYEKSARDETLEQEIRDLEDSRVDQETGQSLPIEEVVAIDAQIQFTGKGITEKADCAKELLIIQWVVFTKTEAHLLEKIMQV